MIFPLSLSSWVPLSLISATSFVLVIIMISSFIYRRLQFTRPRIARLSFPTSRQLLQSMQMRPLHS
ncbi:hypothetical protein BDV34DRAFT_200443 [Aspergillus parasiticus]|uniref:Uncharacterized protein n=1 Tax=Aspergillus parasiticus TaxID=5067 RepID=A0A5N6DBS6_ASPPA|nr:hypothetical protein BDV34DRAFT_200443 [Aspergillus parasiticus]